MSVTTRSVTRGGVTLLVDTFAAHTKAPAVVFRTLDGRVALLEYSPKGRRFVDPATGETGRCDTEDQAFEAAAARLALLESPVVIPPPPVVYGLACDRWWKGAHRRVQSYGPNERG